MLNNLRLHEWMHQTINQQINTISENRCWYTSFPSALDIIYLQIHPLF
jgi:hypothetical protein